MADTRAPGSVRSRDTFGVAGLLAEGCTVYFATLFSPRHLGRVSDLLAARLENARGDELRVRAMLLFGVFEAFRGRSPEFGPSEPLAIECGVDPETLALGVSFNIAPERVATLTATAFADRITGGTPLDDFEATLQFLCRQSQVVHLRVQPDTGRVELVSVIGVPEPRVGAMTLEVVTLGASVGDPPAAGEYIELGDLDYAGLLMESGPGAKMAAPKSGQLLVEALKIRPGESGGGADSERREGGKLSGAEVDGVVGEADRRQDAETQDGGAPPADAAKTRVKGVTERRQVAATRVGGADSADDTETRDGDLDLADDTETRDGDLDSADDTETRDGRLDSADAAATRARGGKAALGGETRVKGVTERRQDAATRVGGADSADDAETQDGDLDSADDTETRDGNLDSADDTETRDGNLDSADAAATRARGGKAALGGETRVKGVTERRQDAATRVGGADSVDDAETQDGDTDAGDAAATRVGGGKAAREDKKRIKGVTERRQDEETRISGPVERIGDGETVVAGSAPVKEEHKKIAGAGGARGRSEVTLVKGEAAAQPEEYQRGGSLAGGAPGASDARQGSVGPSSQEIVNYQRRIAELEKQLAAARGHGSAGSAAAAAGPKTLVVKGRAVATDESGESIGRKIKRMLGLGGSGEEPADAAVIAASGAAPAAPAGVAGAPVPVVVASAAGPAPTGAAEALTETTEAVARHIELHAGSLNETLQRVQGEAGALKKELKSARAQRFVDKMMSELVSERSKLADLSKKLNQSVRQKELEFKNREQMLQEELRKRDEQLHSKTAALARAKEQVAQVSLTVERMKAGGGTGTEEGHLKQRLTQNQRLLQVTKDENTKLKAKLDEVKSQLSSVQYAVANNKGPSPVEFASMQNKLNQSQRVAEDFRRQNAMLMEKLEKKERELRERQPKALGDDVRKRLESAMQMITVARKDSERMKARIEELTREEARLRKDLAAAKGGAGGAGQAA